jgi:hypothetical protein
MAGASLIGAAALYYSTMQPDWLRMLLAVAWGVLAAVMLFARPLYRAAAFWCAAAVILTIWYATDLPSNNRDWEPEYALKAKFLVENGTVSVRNVRNFSYRSESDPIPAYYDASFRLDELASIDLVSSYWQGDTIAHVFLTFGFRDGRHLAFSIETRRAKGAEYSTVAGFFHHYELFYVVADERDLIGVRTDIRREQVYLYRLHLTPEVREALFLSYVDKVNQLASQPEWYNTLSDNCTTGILNRADTLGNISYSWQVLLSGYAANYAYSLGLLDSERSFAELRRGSLIERPANATITSTYSQDIRNALRLPPT